MKMEDVENSFDIQEDIETNHEIDEDETPAAAKGKKVSRSFEHSLPSNSNDN